MRVEMFGMRKVKDLTEGELRAAAEAMARWRRTNGRLHDIILRELRQRGIGFTDEEFDKLRRRG